MSPKEHRKNVLAVYLSPLKADPEHFHRLKQDPLFEAAQKSNLHIVRIIGISANEISSGIITCLDICRASGIKDILIEHISLLFLKSDKQASLLKDFFEQGVYLHIANPQIAWSPQELKHFSDVIMGGLMSLSLEKSRGIIKGLKRAKKRGVKVGQNPFGLADDEQETIRKIMMLYEEGRTLQSICEALKKEKMKTRFRKKWYPMTVLRIIKREQTKAQVLVE